MSRIRTAVSVAVSVALALTLTACGTAQPEEGSQSGTPIVVAYSGEVQTLDPQQSSYGQTNLVGSGLYETLVTYTPDNELVGLLAEEFTPSPDATSIDITLRPGVKFHDGTPLTSKDVQFSLDRYSALGIGIGGLFANYDSTTVTDDQHLTIHLKVADSLFLDKLAKAYILGSAAISENAGADNGQSWLATHDAGTGPYVLETDVLGGNIVVTRYQNYWGYDETRPEQITFRRIDESSTQVQEIKAGNVNYVNNLSVADKQSLEGTSGIKTDNLPLLNQQYIQFNTTTGPTADVRVRRALQMAFDYQAALDSIMLGEGRVANGPLPIGMSCTGDFAAYEKDLDGAKALLAQAGYTDLKLTMRYQPRIADQSREAVMFQSDLASIGVDLELVPITFADYLTLLADDATIPEMTLMADSAQLPTAGAFLTQFYGPASAGASRTGFHDPKVEALLTQAAATSDAEAQCAAYEEATQIIRDASTGIYLLTIGWPLAYTDNLSGVTVSRTVTPLSVSTLRVP